MERVAAHAEDAEHMAQSSAPMASDSVGNASAKLRRH